MALIESEPTRWFSPRLVGIKCDAGEKRAERWAKAKLISLTKLGFVEEKDGRYRFFRIKGKVRKR